MAYRIIQSILLILVLEACAGLAGQEGPEARLNAQEVWSTLDRKPSLEMLLARYPVPGKVQAAMRTAVCSKACQATLRNTQHLQECTILAWEIHTILGCRAKCLDSVATDCEILQSGLLPSRMSLNTKHCSDKQYRIFFKRYQHGNLGGGLLEDLYEAVHNKARKVTPTDCTSSVFTSLALGFLTKSYCL